MKSVDRSFLFRLETRNTEFYTRSMPVASRAEFYFIAAMMFLILVLCTAAVYIFFKTYRKEMREKQQRIEREKAVKAEQQQAANGTEQDHTA